MRPTSRRRSTSRYAILRSSIICASATAVSCVMGRVTAPAGGLSRGAISCALDGMMCAVGLRRYAQLASPLRKVRCSDLRPGGDVRE